MDGMRCIAYFDGSKVKLLSRRGQNITTQYPALVAALPPLCKGKVVLDGEIIALNEQGKPSFQLLQKRMNLLKVSDISRADSRIPVHFFAFDIVYAGEFNLSGVSLMNRKAILNQALTPGPGVLILKHFEDNGRIAYEACIENGFEGIVAKRRESPYEVGRRSPYWVKVKAQKSSEFVIGGYSPGEGSRSPTFGALVLGYYDSTGKLIYAGSVGSGFDERLLADMMRRMTPLKIDKCPFEKVAADRRNSQWIRPELVAEIKFMDWTEDRHLRNPVFLHLRHDINPADVRFIEALSPDQINDECGKMAALPGGDEASKIPVLPDESDESGAAGDDSAGSLAASEPTPELIPTSSISAANPITDDLQMEMRHWETEAQGVLAQLSGKEKNYKLTVDHATISLSNLDKILFPAIDDLPAVSKRDFLKTVAFLSPYILRFLYDRPLTMIRAPSGLRSPSFYQKHWNLDIPDFIESIRTDLEDLTRKDQLLCNNVAALIFLAQHNILEFHSWLSRVPPVDKRGPESPDLTLLDLPDFMAFDIDIHKAGEKESDRLNKDLFKQAAEAALRLKEILDQLGLRSFLKTSGRNGLHVFIPIIRDLRFEEVRNLAEMIARHTERQYTDSISISAVFARRDGKVFMDYQANTRGKTLVIPYSPRLSPKATISAPIEWSELGSIYPDDLNQHSIVNRIAAKKDIWSEISSHPVDLAKRFNSKR